jgi:hypothetical protein
VTPSLILAIAHSKEVRIFVNPEESTVARAFVNVGFKRVSRCVG